MSGSSPTCLDQLPASEIGATCVGGVDLNKAPHPQAMAAELALNAAPSGFTDAHVVAKHHDRAPVRQSAHTCAGYGAETSSQDRQVSPLPVPAQSASHDGLPAGRFP